MCIVRMCCVLLGEAAAVPQQAGGQVCCSAAQVGVHTRDTLTHLSCLSCALVQLLEVIALALHGSSSLHSVYMHIRMIASRIRTYLPCESGVWLSLGVP